MRSCRTGSGPGAGATVSESRFDPSREQGALAALAGQRGRFASHVRACHCRRPAVPSSTTSNGNLPACTCCSPVTQPRSLVAQWQVPAGALADSGPARVLAGPFCSRSAAAGSIWTGIAGGGRSRLAPGRPSVVRGSPPGSSGTRLPVPQVASYVTDQLAAIANPLSGTQCVPAPPCGFKVHFGLPSSSGCRSIAPLLDNEPGPRAGLRGKLRRHAPPPPVAWACAPATSTNIEKSFRFPFGAVCSLSGTQLELGIWF